MLAGIDLSENMLELARELAPAQRAAPITFAISDAGELPFPEASFDAVLCT